MAQNQSETTDLEYADYISLLRIKIHPQKRKKKRKEMSTFDGEASILEIVFKRTYLTQR